MFSPQQVIDTYYLDHRYMLLEIAAFMDRYDAAVERTGEPAKQEQKLDVMKRALEQLHQPPSESGRVKTLLTLFAEA